MSKMMRATLGGSPCPCCDEWGGSRARDKQDARVEIREEAADWAAGKLTL